MQSYDIKAPSDADAIKALRSMADAIESGAVIVQRIGLFGESRGLVNAPFDFTLSGMAVAQRALK